MEELLRTVGFAEPARVLASYLDRPEQAEALAAACAGLAAGIAALAP